MTSKLLKVVDLLSVNDISAINTEDGGEHALHRINNKTTSTVLSPPMVHSCQKIPLSPVYRLPPELLSIIFLQYTRQWHCEYSLSTSTAEIPRWVYVSYVCQYWRNIALNCSDLWTHLFFVSSRWMDELLRRSKTAPLIIHADISCLRTDRAIRAIKPLIKALGHMDRIQDLWISFPINITAKVFAGLTCARLTARPAPLLRSFHLSSQNRMEVRKDIFAGVMPCLREVHLEFCQVHWSSPIFNFALTELNLCRLTNHSEMDFHGLLLALRRLSSLRRLYLDGILPDAAMANTRNMQPVPVKATLPRLEKITLVDSVSRVSSLLDHLEFPQSTIVRLECTYLNTPDPVVFQPFIRDRFGNHPSLPPSPVLCQPVFLRSLDIRRSGPWEDGWKVTCGTSNTYGANIHLLEGEAYQDVQFPLQVEFVPMPGGGKIALHGIIAFIRTLPVAHLNMITLHGDNSYHNNQYLWTEVFKDAQELRVIRLECSDANPLICALQPRNRATFAYSLTDIEFKEVHFNQAARNKRWSKWSHDHCESGCLYCLHDAVVSCAEVGNVIQRLCFDNCTGITKNYVTKLSELVGKVEWTPQMVKCAVLCLLCRY